MKKEYKYQENGEVLKIEEERWGWSVVYKATEEQKKRAEAITADKLQALEIEKNQQLKAMRENNETEDRIKALKDEYEYKMSQHFKPEQDTLSQFDSNGTFHRFAEIDKERVDIFVMHRMDDIDLKKRIDLKIEEGAQIFHFYRNFGFDYQNSKLFRKVKVYCFGWKKGSEEHYVYILPDDRIVMGAKDIDLTQFDL